MARLLNEELYREARVEVARREIPKLLYRMCSEPGTKGRHELFDAWCIRNNLTTAEGMAHLEHVALSEEGFHYWRLTQ